MLGCVKGILEVCYICVNGVLEGGGGLGLFLGCFEGMSWVCYAGLGVC